MTEIKFDDGFTSGSIDFEKGLVSFYADSGYTEKEGHGGELTKAQTKALYESMKAYYEDLETAIGRAIGEEGFQGSN